MPSTTKVKNIPADALHAIVIKTSGTNHRVRYTIAQGLIIKALFQPGLAIRISLAVITALFSCYINVLMSIMRLLICFLIICIPHLLHDVSISFDFSA